MATTMTTGTAGTAGTSTGMTGRRSWSFLSFLGGGEGGGGGVEADQAKARREGGAAHRRTLREEERKQARLVDDARYRMSTQHAHPLGPWRAMSVAVRRHNDAWGKGRDKMGRIATADDVDDDDDDDAPPGGASPHPPYRVLDLACGPRGEPGTTIARLLPLAAVLCTDSSAEFVASVPVVGDCGGGGGGGGDRRDARSSSAPPNLTKSVLDMSDLAAHASGSFDAVVCCYGIGLAPDARVALSEAHRVLTPGGVLVVATWEGSDLLSVGRDVLGTVRGGGHGPSSSRDDDLEAFLPPRFPPPPANALAGPGVIEALLVGAGFDHPGAVVSTGGTYPLDLGGHPDDVLTAGTMLVRGELEALGAFGPEAAPSGVPGGWASPVEEAFWTSVRKYADVGEGGTTLLRGNTFKITVSTKGRRRQSHPDDAHAPSSRVG